MEQTAQFTLLLNHRNIDLMAKDYIEGETKDQRKARKERERNIKAKNKQAKKQVEVTPAPAPKPKAVDKSNKNYIVCLKHGSKYSSQYVNVLSSMVARHTTLPYEFVCFTDDKRGINSNITTIPLKEGHGMHGWWYKPMFFDKNFPLQGNILFFDLDVIIHDNIDKLLTFNNTGFSICRDFNRSIRNDWNHFNSSIFKLYTGSLAYVYDEFVKDSSKWMRKFHGDQDWINAQVKDKGSQYQFWPDNWIRSYKWEMRDRKDLARINGYRNFTNKAEPRIIRESCVAVFHGEPHPHQCEDDWVKENWR